MEVLEEKKRDSDEDPEISEDETESEGASFDSEEEDMFIDGMDPDLDRCPSEPSDGEISDEDWEPEATAEKSKQSLSPPSPTTKVPETPPSTESPRPVEQEIGSKSPHTPQSAAASSEERWHDENEADIEPPQPIFRPSRTPGPQLSATSSSTLLELFQLFFSTSVMTTIVKNTNAYGAKSMEGNARPWHDISMQDMYSYLALVIYMCITKFSDLTDYWSPFYSLPFPRSVMSRRKFLAISHALHLSDPDVDTENEGKRGTADFDRLCKIKPLYLQLVEACKAQFHPAQNIAVDERMVASKAWIGLQQHMEENLTCGYKLFVLADSRCGYTWNFFVYDGKSPVENGKGLSYESVMALIDEKVLGTGYKLFMDEFYTSPMLFKDLLQKKVWACGTVRPNRAGVPRALTNDFPRKAPRGSLRWLRDNELLFVKWKDAGEVMMCTTFHKAYKGDTVQKRVKGDDGQPKYKDVPIPAVITDYNTNLEGVDLSDTVIGYDHVLLKTKKWYKTLFYHFVGIAVGNAYVLHRELARANGTRPFTQKGFRETLVLELAHMGSESNATPGPASPPPPGVSHRPKFTADDSAIGRRKCKLCHQKTAMICVSCDAPLCLLPNRNCFNEWHDQNGL